MDLEKINIEWNFENSIFKVFKFENDELLSKCFEFDYNQTKIPKLTKNSI